MTNVDDAKIHIYQDRGVSERWRVDREQEDAAPIMTFLAIPEEGSAYPVDTSRVLPGVTPVLFEVALQAAALQTDGEKARSRLRRLLITHGALAVRRATRGEGTSLQP